MLAVALFGTSPSCTASVFQCSETEDCQGRPGGVCEPTGYCSFPDDACPSGRRYGEFSQGSLSGACVVPDEGTSTSAGEGSGTASGSVPATLSASSSGSSDTTTTDDVETTTMGVSIGGSTSSSGADPTRAESSSATTSLETGSSSTGAEPELVEIVSTLAACTDPVANDPAACELSTETQGMSVDTENSGAMGAPTTAFVAFEVTDELAAATILSADVRLTATDDPNSESMTQSGELWLTEAFTLASLATGQPALLGDGPIAPDQGTVVTSETVTWDLEPSDLDLSATVFIAVVPTTPEGVDYWNSEGDQPPRLRLLVQP